MAPNIQTKEHLVYFMQSGSLRLGRNDLHFLRNLNYLLVNKTSVTSNQVSLFEKLVKKYNKQLTKHGLTSELLSSLIWETTAIPSTSEYTQAFISIVDNKIIFKSPYNKKFVQAFAKLEFNSFDWVTDRRVYESPYSTQALKNIFYIANKFYPIVNYCPISTDILNLIKEYDAKYWNPTLVYTGGQYLIAGINESLNDAIGNIELSNDPCCISKLASYGILIDDSILNDDPLLEFASKYSVDFDYVNLYDLIKYLHALKCDAVVITGVGLASRYHRDVIVKLKQSGFHVEEIKFNKKNPSKALNGYSNRMMITLSSFSLDCYYVDINFTKVIKLKNSMQIEFK